MKRLTGLFKTKTELEVQNNLSNDSTLSFQELLDSLKTKDARRFALYKAVEKGITKDPKHIDELVLLYEQSGYKNQLLNNLRFNKEFLDYIYRKEIDNSIAEGEYENAISILLHHLKDVESAIDIALKYLKNPRRAFVIAGNNNLDRAIEIGRDIGLWFELGELCFFKDHYDEALGFYNKTIDDISQPNVNLDRAYNGVLFNRPSYREMLIDSLEKIICIKEKLGKSISEDEINRVIKLMVLKDKARAASYAEWHGHLEQAFGLYIEDGGSLSLQRASNILMKQAEQATSESEKQILLFRAALGYSEYGDMEIAGRLYHQLGLKHKASELLEKVIEKQESDFQKSKELSLILGNQQLAEKYDRLHQLLN